MRCGRCEVNSLCVVIPRPRERIVRRMAAVHESDRPEVRLFELWLESVNATRFRSGNERDGHTRDRRLAHGHDAATGHDGGHPAMVHSHARAVPEQKHMRQRGFAPRAART